MMNIFTKPAGRRLLLLAVLGLTGVWIMTGVPGESYTGPLPTLDDGQRQIRRQLQDDVVILAGIGARHVHRPARLADAAEHVQQRFEALGYTVNSQEYQVVGRTCRNLEAELTGAEQPERIVVVGAHYDSVATSPGADDNASGVAVLLALAEAFANRRPGLTLRFVAFVNEEPPWFQTEKMGSLVYARAARERNETIAAMVSLDGVGYYSDVPGSQDYPPPFSWLYPDTGNFIGFVSRLGDRGLVRRCVGAFREQAKLPSEGGVAPSFIPGIGWSDHWSFWQCGYPAILVTDSLPFRNPRYHLASDAANTLDYERMTLLVDGMVAVVADLASCEEP